MDETAISWCQDEQGRPGSTWNPTDGCAVCSPGCKNCYAMQIAGRFSKPGQHYHGLVTFGKNKKAVWNGEGRLNTKALLKPLHWRRARPVFVDSTADLFFEAILDEEIAASFGVMAAARQHRYMILTKRAKRMHAWYRWFAQNLDEAENRYPGDLAQLAWCYTRDAMRDIVSIDNSAWNTEMLNSGHELKWPLPHVWQGVSVDTRKHGLPRIDYLRDVDAAVRFLSIEPLLEDLGKLNLRGIHWVIVGCESGAGARDCHPDWIRSVVEQCQEQDVPVWLKQAVPWDEGHTSIVARGIGFGPGSKRKKGGVVELPYLDSKQYKELPRVAA